MKKSDVIKEISKRLFLPRAECEMVIETFADVVTEALSEGENVSIRGFVSFEVSEYKSREGYNPISGEVEKFKPTRTVKCKVGRPIKQAVNQNEG